MTGTTSSSVHFGEEDEDDADILGLLDDEASDLEAQPLPAGMDWIKEGNDEKKQVRPVAGDAVPAPAPPPGRAAGAAPGDRPPLPAPPAALALRASLLDDDSSSGSEGFLAVAKSKPSAKRMALASPSGSPVQRPGIWQAEGASTKPTAGDVGGSRRSSAAALPPPLSVAPAGIDEVPTPGLAPAVLSPTSAAAAAAEPPPRRVSLASLESGSSIAFSDADGEDREAAPAPAERGMLIGEEPGAVPRTFSPASTATPALEEHCQDDLEPPEFPAEPAPPPLCRVASAVSEDTATPEDAGPPEAADVAGQATLAEEQQQQEEEEEGSEADSTPETGPSHAEPAPAAPAAPLPRQPSQGTSVLFEEDLGALRREACSSEVEDRPTLGPQEGEEAEEAEGEEDGLQREMDALMLELEAQRRLRALYMPTDDVPAAAATERPGPGPPPAARARLDTVAGRLAELAQYLERLCSQERQQRALQAVQQLEACRGEVVRLCRLQDDLEEDSQWLATAASVEASVGALSDTLAEPEDCWLLPQSWGDNKEIATQTAAVGPGPPAASDVPCPAPGTLAHAEGRSTVADGRFEERAARLGARHAALLHGLGRLEAQAAAIAESSGWTQQQALRRAGAQHGGTLQAVERGDLEAALLRRENQRLREETRQLRQTLQQCSVPEMEALKAEALRLEREKRDLERLADTYRRAAQREAAAALPAVADGVVSGQAGETYVARALRLLEENTMLASENTRLSEERRKAVERLAQLEAELATGRQREEEAHQLLRLQQEHDAFAQRCYQLLRQSQDQQHGHRQEVLRLQRRLHALQADLRASQVASVVADAMPHPVSGPSESEAAAWTMLHEARAQLQQERAAHAQAKRQLEALGAELADAQRAAGPPDPVPTDSGPAVPRPLYLALVADSQRQAEALAALQQAHRHQAGRLAEAEQECSRLAVKMQDARRQDRDRTSPLEEEVRALQQRLAEAARKLRAQEGALLQGQEVLATTKASYEAELLKLRAEQQTILGDCAGDQQTLSARLATLEAQAAEAGRARAEAERRAAQHEAEAAAQAAEARRLAAATERLDAENARLMAENSRLAHEAFNRMLMTSEEKAMLAKENARLAEQAASLAEENRRLAEDRLASSDQKQAYLATALHITQLKHQLQVDHEAQEREALGWADQRRALEAEAERLRCALKAAEDVRALEAEAAERRVGRLVSQAAAAEEAQAEETRRLQRRIHNLELQLADVTFLYRHTTAERDALQVLEAKQGPLINANLQLALDRGQLLEEKARLAAHNAQLQEDVRRLSDTLQAERQRLAQEALSKEAALVEANVRLATERNRILEERGQLAAELEAARGANQDLQGLALGVYGMENQRLSAENDRLAALLEETTVLYQTKVNDLVLEQEKLLRANAQLERDVSRQAAETRRWAQDVPRLLREVSRLQPRRATAAGRPDPRSVPDHVALNDAIARLAEASAQLIQENTQLADENAWLHDVTLQLHPSTPPPTAPRSAGLSPPMHGRLPLGRAPPWQQPRRIAGSRSPASSDGEFPCQRVRGGSLDEDRSQPVMSHENLMDPCQ